jgi:hypothetical protein
MRAGRLGEAQPMRESLVRDLGVAGEGGEDLEVDLVELRFHQQDPFSDAGFDSE